MTSGLGRDFTHAREQEGELTKRQRDVLRLIAKGHTNPEIAERLGITVDGAKWHVSEMLGKLGLDTREDLADYWRWRNRAGTRLARALRGFVGLGALKLAAGGGAFAVMAAVGVVSVLLASGDGSETASPMAAFYLEATVTYQAPAGSPAGPSSVPADVRKTLIRIWRQDADHQRLEFETILPAIDSGEITVMVTNGADSSTLLTPANTYTTQKVPVPSGASRLPLPIPFSVLIGPSGESDTAALLQMVVRDWPQAAGRAEVVGQQTLLGRNTAIIEYGPQTAPRRRMWLDPLTMQVLRHEYSAVVAEVTHLDEAPVMTPDTFVLTPPAGARLQPPSDARHGSGSAGSPPSGVLAPRYLPPGFVQLGSGREEGSGGAATTTLWYGPNGTAKDAIPLSISQKPRPGDVPESLQAGQELLVGTDRAWATSGAAGNSLAFMRNGSLVIIESTTLPVDELVRIAESLKSVG